METVKLLINVSTFSMTQKINKLESILKEKSEEQENKYNKKLDEQKNNYNLKLDNIGSKIYLSRPYYYPNWLPDFFGNPPTLSFHIYSKIINLESFIHLYSSSYQPIYYQTIYIKAYEDSTNQIITDKYSPFTTTATFKDPFLLISLNVYQKLKLIILDDDYQFIINVFTNDKMIDGHENMQNNAHNSSPIYTRFNSRPTPLFTVEVIIISLSAFLSYDSSLDYETYTNFFKNIFPNLKTICISVNHGNKICYNKNDFMKTSIEYGINYIINNTLIEKIIFTSYYHYHTLITSLDNDTSNYLKNIVNSNKTRNIILEIKNIITYKELKEIFEL